MLAFRCPWRSRERYGSIEPHRRCSRSVISLYPPAQSLSQQRTEECTQPRSGEPILELPQPLDQSLSAEAVAVARRQYGRLELRDCDHRFLRHLPVPRRVPRRAREPVLVAPTCPLHHPSQGVRIHAQDGVARDQDAIRAAEEGGVTRRVAGHGDAFPVRETRESGGDIEGTRVLAEIGASPQRLAALTRHGVHHRQNNPSVQRRRPPAARLR